MFLTQQETTGTHDPIEIEVKKAGFLPIPPVKLTKTGLEAFHYRILQGVYGRLEGTSRKRKRISEKISGTTNARSQELKT